MKKTFWDKNAKRYDSFMRKDSSAYEELYKTIRPIVKNKSVLELAAGTGQISKNIADCAQSIESTDASPDMIAKARENNTFENLHFSVQDMFSLPYKDASFDVVIAANVLHVIPTPEKALCEIRRVIKNDGVLLAPTFTHADNRLCGKIKAFFMKLAGFPLHSKWSNGEFIAFLKNNGWTVKSSFILNASFPMTYAECTPADRF